MDVIKIKKALLLSIVPLAVMLVALASLLVWKVNSVSKIKLNQTYTFSTTHAAGDAPSYIKVLDDSHYVDMPLLQLDQDYDQIVSILFIQGTYSKHHNTIKLGRKVKGTVLVFSNYQLFEKGDYTVQHPKIVSNNSTLPFAGSSIQRKNSVLYYKWTIGKYYKNKPDTYRSRLIRLKKAKLNLPTTEKEFIQSYHKKQGHQQE